MNSYQSTESLYNNSTESVISSILTTRAILSPFQCSTGCIAGGTIVNHFMYIMLVRKLVFGFSKIVKASQHYIVQAICGSDMVEVFN